MRFRVIIAVCIGTFIALVFIGAFFLFMKDKNSAYNRQLMFVQALLESGTLNEKNEYGRTPLFIAAMTGQSVRVRLLVEAGASIHTKDNSRYTPLHDGSLRGAQGGGGVPSGEGGFTPRTGQGRLYTAPLGSR